MMTKPPNIDPANTWVVSDSHWGHRNIVGFCNRPEDHEEIMVREWIEQVPEDSTVLHLGDISYRNNAYFRSIIAPKLTGRRKLLIRGNHDKQRTSFYRAAGFKLVAPFEMVYKLDKVNYVVGFSHYPLTAPAPENHIHIHGHIHNNGYGGKQTPYTPFSAGQINISVEQTHYRPVNLKRLLDGHILGCYE